MIVKDENLLRSLLALKGLHKQVDIANALDMSANSVVRMFKRKPVLRSTARRVARLVGRRVDELFVVDIEEETDEAPEEPEPAAAKPPVSAPRPRIAMPDPGPVPDDKAQAEAERKAALLAQAAGRMEKG